jgi:hypothetical protein
MPVASRDRIPRITAERRIERISGISIAAANEDSAHPPRLPSKLVDLLEPRSGFPADRSKHGGRRPRPRGPKETAFGSRRRVE